jgi:hypothetical protein
MAQQLMDLLKDVILPSETPDHSPKLMSQNITDQASAPKEANKTLRNSDHEYREQSE